MILPSHLANVAAPFVPQGGAPVGEEDAEQRRSSLKPVEEGAQSAERQAYRQPPGSEEGGDRSEQGREQKDAQSDLSEQRREQEMLEQREMAARDRRVRTHEQAHAAVAGQYGGSPVYEFERGPDGVAYAVSGHVPIDTRKIPDDPEATLAKAQQIRRAAMAPADPSPQDRRVALEALRLEMQARAEILAEQLDSGRNERTDGEPGGERQEGFVESAGRAEGKGENGDDRENAQALRELTDRLSHNQARVSRHLADIGALDLPEPRGHLFDQNA